MGHKHGRGKSGLSTLLSGVIVVGIVLSVLSPLFFHINNLSNFYDSVSTEMRDLDQQRNWEKLDIYIKNMTIDDEIIPYIFITNISPIAIKISRIYVVYDISSHDVYIQSEILQPQERMTIDDTIIDLTGLFYEDYCVKVATERGYIFSAYFLPVEPPNPGYWLPLSIDGATSKIWNDGSKYFMDLTVENWMRGDNIVNCSYFIITTQYLAGGTPSQIKVLDNSTYPDIFNPSIDFPGDCKLEFLPERWIWSTPYTLEFDANPGAAVIKCELVDADNYVIGAYYFRMEL